MTEVPIHRDHNVVSRNMKQTMAENILSRDWRKKNLAHRKYKKDNRDHVLSGYTASCSKAVRHRYILFVFMVSSVFSAFCPGLVYLGPKALKNPCT